MLGNDDNSFLKFQKALVVASIIIICFLFSILLLTIFQFNALNIYKIIFIQPFSSPIKFSLLIDRYAYFIICGLSAIAAFRFKVYNFGIPGQMIFAGIITFLISRLFTKIGIYNSWLVLLLVFVALFAGAIYGLIASLLKIFFRVNEIGSTILLNLIAWKGYQSLEYWNLYNDGIIDKNASLLIFDNNNLVYYSAAIIIAIISFGVISVLLDRRLFGFKLELVSINQNAAQYSRLEPKTSFLLVMIISSSLAGLAGYIYFVGTKFNLVNLNNFFISGYDGIFVSLLAINTRWGILFSALLFAFIDSQTVYLDDGILFSEFWKLILFNWIYLSIILNYSWNYGLKKFYQYQLLKKQKMQVSSREL